MQPLALLLALLAAFPLAGLAQLTEQQLAALPALRRILMMHQRVLTMHQRASIESDVRPVDLVVRQRNIQLQSRHLFIAPRVPNNIPDNIPPGYPGETEYFLIEVEVGEKKVSRGESLRSFRAIRTWGKRNRRTFTIQAAKATRAGYASGNWNTRGADFSEESDALTENPTCFPNPERKRSELPTSLGPAGLSAADIPSYT